MRTLPFFLKSALAGGAIGVLAALALWWLDAPPRPAAAPASYAEAVARAAPAVVTVFTRRERAVTGRPRLDALLGLPPRQENGLGSGVILDEAGHIVTNYHVVKDADNIHVWLLDGRDAPARLLGADPETDLAVLATDLADLEPVEMGAAERLRVGDVVLAIGNPYGVGQTVTLGIVSATGADRMGLSAQAGFIQTDAAINPGNSGGALVDSAGRLVGINTAIYSRSGGSDGIGFAIPVDTVRAVVAQILEYGTVRRGWLGVEGRSLGAPLAGRLGLPVGVLVTAVVPGGPADRAGLAAGDVIVGAEGTPTPTARALARWVAGQAPGSRLTLEVWRDGTSRRLTVTLGERPPG